MSEDLSNTRLSELICTRISHDLIGNIGAVSNAVELLEEDDSEFMDDIRSILNTSAKVLSARLKFFRLTFGLNNANLENLSLAEETLRGYLETIGNRNFPIGLEFSLSRPAVLRGVLCAAMIWADCLIRGGAIAVSEKDGTVAVTLRAATAPAAEKLAAVVGLLNGGKAEANAQFAPVFYLLSWAKGANINIRATEEGQPSILLTEQGS